jgi:hypothetical protein
MANIKKRVPPIIPITFSDKYFATTAPPETAIPVATAWAAIAPTATLYGFCAADKAMVDRKDLSPNSAANTNPKMLKMRALYYLKRHTIGKPVRRDFITSS